jgi:hypothetical protein
MPTGYTADVADGKVTELKDYILTVSRGMGFAYHLRDTGPTDGIPLQEEGSHYQTSYEDAVEKLDLWLKMSSAVRRAEYNRYVEDVESSNKRAVERHNKELSNYNNMIAKVEAWEVPDFLESTKEFALEQLRSSVDFDCGHGPYTSKVQPFEEWLVNHEAGIHRDVEYYRKKLEEERERTAEANRYIKSLYESLGLESP